MTKRVMSAIVPSFRTLYEAGFNASPHVLELHVRPVLYAPVICQSPPKAMLDGRQTLCDYNQSIFTPKTHSQGRVTTTATFGNTCQVHNERRMVAKDTQE